MAKVQIQRKTIFITLISIFFCSAHFVSAKTTTHHAHHKIHKKLIKNKKHVSIQAPREKVRENLAAVIPAQKSMLPVTESSAPLNHALASINWRSLTHTIPSTGLMSSIEKNVINFIHHTVEGLRYSSYKLGGTYFDTTRGVYIVDCSSFVDHILQNVYPNAYLNLVNSVGTNTPASSHYYQFFRELSQNSDEYWNQIADVDELRPGDILVFRYKNARGAQTGGHVMVVMNKPVRISDVYFVRIADSAPSGHSADTRQPHTSGIGIGTLLLKANPKTGKPSAFAWGARGYWNRNVNFAMARPSEIGL